MQMNVRECDPYFLTTRLISDYVRLLRSRQLEKLISTNLQLAPAHICGVLQPPALRERITAEVTVSNPELSKNWASFVDYVLDKTAALEDFCPITQQYS